jgi:chorismate mutase/prephenate dehydratase
LSKSEEIELSKIRKDIDSIDDRLLQLYNERMKLVKRVGEVKHRGNSPIYRPEREREILDRLYSLNRAEDGILSEKAIDALFLELFSVARNLERPEKIAYLGPEGSFTHQVAESRFGAISDYLPLNAIKDVVNAVESGQAKFGVLPIENSSNGIVGETFDLLEKTSLKIIAEVYISVHHSFVSLSGTLKDVKRIYSKDIAFKQCEKFLEAHNLNEVDLIPVESTAKAAYLASNDPQSGAICSSIASKLYNIPTLFENIEDSSTNKTRFIILSDFTMGEYPDSKTSIIVRFDDESDAGALFKFLKGFNDQNISLSRIQSRPNRDSHFKYSFFIDFDGDYRDSNIMEILEPYRENIKWLGTYLEDK